MSKKATMDLGINFSFVIVVALIMLGIALYFVLNVFKYADEKIPGSAPEIIFHANPDNPFYPEERELKLAPGEQGELLISIYNQEWSSEENIIVSLQICTDAEGLTEDKISLNSISQTIPREKDRGYLTIIAVGKEVNQGLHICSLMAGASDNEGFVDTSKLYYSRQISVNII